jgi:2-dehydro-3-deoxyphosphogluconate aldolase/(4S)-4-hydroxy-2-oxoglutarate aldolase
MNPIREFLAIGPVMPVVVIDRVEQAVPLARALMAGGIRVVEVTLRTACALDAMREIRAAVPEMVVGAGTVLNARDLEAARQAGAAFAVSPGATEALLEAGRDPAIPLLPGVMTPSDVVRALEHGYDTCKLFPARVAGGVPMLSSLAGPFPQLRFCPTGGIDPSGAHEYLALPNVLCVGGTWIAPARLVAAGDWAGIEAHARGAASLHRPAKS